jgi:Icc-related predicted phosphoesterase
MPRIFFATDLHGSEMCWRKFLNAAKFYDAEVLICGGDMTGKAMIPIVEENGHYTVTIAADRQVVSADQVGDIENQIRRKGYYPLHVTPERLQEVDDVVRESDMVELGEGQVVEIDGFTMISTGWSNHTPWNTHREETEDKLGERIEAMARNVSDFSHAIFNLHCPPFRSGLDEAPAIDADLKLLHGGRALRPVGSTAVRQLIDKHQPLLSLHGHIHESKGAVKLGKTLAINPGSAYEEGILMAAVINLDAKKGIKSYQLVNG